MAVFPRNIYLALKQELMESPVLSYVDKVVIRKWDNSTLPDFSHHCILISPVAARPTYYAAAQRQIINEIDLVLLVKVVYTEEDAIVGLDKTLIPPKVGILVFWEDVFLVLYQNTLRGEIELGSRNEELDTGVNFSLRLTTLLEPFIIVSEQRLVLRGERFI